MQPKVNHYSETLIKFFTKDVEASHARGITVNPIVSEIASWYEKFRNAMEYRQDEVILQTTILRILKRRSLLGVQTQIAAPLVKELIWARYLQDGSVPETKIKEAEEKITLYINLKKYITEHKILKEADATEWMYHLLSSDLENLLSPSHEREAMVNYIFHALHPNIAIENDDEEAINIQLFIAIRRTYTKDNLALLRFNLFRQYFGELTLHNYEKVSQNFKQGHQDIEKALAYPRRHKISSYVKRYIPPFLILEEILRTHKANIHELLSDEEAFSNLILETCERKYKGIASKVRRAIVRSVIFILMSKVLFAFAVEGTFERYVYGHIQWVSLILNIIIPTSLMVVASFFITTPKRDNSVRILQAIKELLYSDKPRIGYTVVIGDPSKKKATIWDFVFTTLWLTTFLVSFGIIVTILTYLQFNFVSQGIFLFFVAIVSFLTYRINQTAHIYTLEERQSIKTLMVDFFFLPVVRVGRHLTEGISQINIFLFLFDYIIETPFKGLFAFFDQWFLFLHNKRENLE